MKTLEVLGTGCKRCETLATNVEAAARELGIEFDLVKVTDINEILQFDVLTTPALAVDGEVKLAGRVATVDEIKQLLQ